MSDAKGSGIYGKPRFGLIVAMFFAAIIVLLIAGWFFLRAGPLKLRTKHPATGMTILYQPR